MYKFLLFVVIFPAFLFYGCADSNEEIQTKLADKLIYTAPPDTSLKKFREIAKEQEFICAFRPAENPDPENPHLHGCDNYERLSCSKVVEVNGKQITLDVLVSFKDDRLECYRNQYYNWVPR